MPLVYFKRLVRYVKVVFFPSKSPSTVKKSSHAIPTCTKQRSVYEVQQNITYHIACVFVCYPAGWRAVRGRTRGGGGRTGAHQRPWLYLSIYVMYVF